MVVSAAARATGSTVGQIARARGCKVIGLVGSAEKAQVICDLGFDAAIDYRATPDLAAEISKAAPEGVEVYFDNVGGETLEAILPLMRLHGRVPICGMIVMRSYTAEVYDRNDTTLRDRGVYEDTCVRVSGKWLFKSRSFCNVHR